MTKITRNWDLSSIGFMQRAKSAAASDRHPFSSMKLCWRRESICAGAYFGGFSRPVFKGYMRAQIIYKNRSPRRVDYHRIKKARA